MKRNVTVVLKSTRQQRTFIESTRQHVHSLPYGINGSLSSFLENWKIYDSIIVDTCRDNSQKQNWDVRWVVALRDGKKCRKHDEHDGVDFVIVCSIETRRTMKPYRIVLYISWKHSLFHRRDRVIGRNKRSTERLICMHGMKSW